ncbi:MAG: site-2 protease family protein [Epsilonproteobacteria bacterium]|nr:site-2 protease family protein [Campylobacterota bacterium]
MFNSQDVIHYLAYLSVVIPAFLAALSFHEFAHAWTATLCGDNTAKRMGRLTLNPLAHIDPIGLLFLVILRIGWAKPVPFDYRNFKRPVLYAVLTAFAGPFANLLLALVCFLLIKLGSFITLPLALASGLFQILTTTAYVNIMLGIFNLLPIPPLDGSHLLLTFLTQKFPAAAIWLYRYSLLILIALLYFTPLRNYLAYAINGVTLFLKQLVF